MAFPDQLNPEKLPRHIAVIMDGNGRWAKKQGKIRTFGHNHAVKAVRDVTEGAAEIGIEVLTLYAFSTENWNRPKYEVNALMTLLVSTIHKEVKTLNENNIRLKAIGDFNALPKKCQLELNQAIKATAANTRMTLILALSYSGRWDIVQSIRKVAEDIASGNLKPEQINDSVIANNLSTAEFPEPELMIRTSGEYRISNFLLWQLAYAELYFTDKLWPDFRRTDLFQAIADYQNRERRFGKTSEQVVSDKA